MYEACMYDCDEYVCMYVIHASKKSRFLKVAPSLLTTHIRSRYGLDSEREIESKRET